MAQTEFRNSAVVNLEIGDSLAVGSADTALRSDSRRAVRSGSNTANFLGPVFTPGATLPPINPPDPNLDTGNPEFRFTLPRVQPQTSSLTLSVQSTRLTIENIDMSNYETQWEISLFLDEPSVGSIVLVEDFKGETLDPVDPANSHIRRGSRISLTKLYFDGTEEISFQNFYIVEVPQYEEIPGIGATLTLIVGDEFRVTDGERLTLTEPFCGPDPQTFGEAMELFFRLRRGVSLPFPRGSNLIEPIERIRNESAHQFAASLYGGAGQLVRTDRLNCVRVGPRPSFNSAQALELDFTNLLSAPRSLVTGQLPYSSVEGNSEGTRLSSPEFRRVADTQFDRGYDPLDLTPWFLGGRGGFTERVRHFLGDVLVFERRESMGYIPNDASFLRSTDTSGPCIDSTGSGVWNSGNVTFGTYQTFEFRIDSTPHPNGARRITRESSRTEGLQYVLEGDTYTRFPPTGLATLTERQVEYDSVALPDNLVCPKNQTWVITREFIIERGVIDTSFELVNILERLTRSFRVGGTPVSVGIVVGQDDRWTRRIEETTYDRDLELFIAADVIEIEQDPDETRFIPLTSTAIRLLRIPASIPEIAAEFGSAQPAEPINIDFAYTVSDMNAALDLWLRTRAGAYGWLAVDLPWEFAFDIGQSVWFTNRRGSRLPYICDSITERGESRSVAIAARLTREYL